MSLDVIYSRIINYVYKILNISVNIKQNSLKLCMSEYSYLLSAHAILFKLFGYKIVGFGIVTFKL